MESSSSCNTMILSLDRAARLNNRGTELLEAGDLTNARECFRQALASLTVSARALAHLPDVSVNNNNNNSHMASASTMQLSMDSVPWLASKYTNQPDASCTYDSIIYNRAIPVPMVDLSTRHRLSGESEDTFNQTLSSSCCIFNLALIYHMRAMQIMMSPSSNKYQSGSQRQHLLKAKSLYAKCSSLVFSMGLGCYVGKHPVADLLSMAVLNNHAHVCHELASYETANDCIDCLVQIMSRVSPCTYRNQEAQFVIHQAKQNFHLNAMILMPPAVAHAA